MRIAIIGTRGIPNHYGGFEQFAEYLAKGLVKRGFEIIVYNSHNHPYQEKELNGVKIVHCYDPEVKIGTAGQFIYDLNCIVDVRKRKCDIILQLGYTSSSIWGRFLPKNCIITTNMDGLEWKRTKYSPSVKRFLRYAETLAIKYSHHLISDSVGIQDYLMDTYNVTSTYIAYGATLFKKPDINVLKQYGLIPFEYDMVIARLEPENSIEIILDGVVTAKLKRPFIVIGKHKTTYGKYLKSKFSKYPMIQFIGGIYDIELLNNLRYYTNLYFHGHTVGGTNPSLLEAMASRSLICANKNTFNESILGADAIYFNDDNDVAMHLLNVNCRRDHYQLMIKNNSDKVVNIYDWKIIIDKYADHFNAIVGISPSVPIPVDEAI